MKLFYHKLAQAIDIALNVEITDTKTLTSLDSASEKAGALLARFPITIFPMGFSQMNSGGSPNFVYYFCMKIVCDRINIPTDVEKDDFIQLGEKLAKWLHGMVFNGRKIYLSKCMIIDSSFVLQNSNRRINVKLKEDQIGQILFFWAVDISEGDGSGRSITAFSPSASGDNDTPGESEVTESQLLASLHQTALEELFP